MALREREEEKAKKTEQLAALKATVGTAAKKKADDEVGGMVDDVCVFFLVVFVAPLRGCFGDDRSCCFSPHGCGA